ncbi:MAG: hypothetical protein LBI59_11325, partial [Candidatus Accumulibacter sp.]|nr:hypothetical protein [Accumulibacter sp.]
ERIVLIAFGGFAGDSGASAWPAAPGVRYLAPGSRESVGGNVTAIESLDMDFTDLVRSVDAVLTKPGYGTFTEAACNGAPVLYVRRDDWPEQDCLIEWLEENACCLDTSAASLARGELRDDLERLWRKPRPEPPFPRGAEEAARLIAGYLE